MWRGSRRATLAALLFALGLVAGQSAEATLIGQSVSVTLGDGGSLLHDDVVTVGSGVELSAGDGSDIGTVLLPKETIDIGAIAIKAAK